MMFDSCQNSPSEQPDVPSSPRRAASWATGRVAIGLQRLRRRRATGQFGILMYHRVTDHVAGVPHPTLNVTPNQLRRQLEGLLERGFEAWPLQRLVKYRQASRAIPSHAFAVTFDDGYENNFVSAIPILRELKIPATIFVATEYLDSAQPFPFDNWSAAGSKAVPAVAWRPMSTDQCRAIAAEGFVELGAHTHSHERFLGRPEAFRADMERCLTVLRERFGIVRPTFAFPFGDTSHPLVEIVRQLDVVCSVCTHHRQVLPEENVYEWGRFYVDEHDSPALLAAKLSGWYSTVSSTGKSLVRPLAAVSRVASRVSRRFHKNMPTESAAVRKALSRP